MFSLPVFTALVLSLAGSSIASTKKCDKNNNLMRCFISSSQLALPYCSSILSIPTATSTYTITSTSYLTVPTLASIETDVVQSTDFLTSYTPVVITTTQTISTTTYVAKAPENIPKRDPKAPKAPKSSPTALACLNDLKPAQSSSSVALACSCLAITPVTSTVTSTQYLTATALSSYTSTTTTTTVTDIIDILPSTTIQTVSAIETDSTSCFKLAIASAADASLIGQVLMLTASDYDTTVGQLTHFDDPTVAGSFYLSSTNALVAGLNGVYPGNPAGIDSGVSAFYIQFGSAAAIAGYQFVNLVCSVDAAGILSCMDASGDGDNLLEFCSDLENHLLIANYLIDEACSVVTLQTTPISCNGVA